jgi:hypothetical protein
VSRKFADRFRLWLDENYPAQAPHIVYSAEVELSDHLRIPLGIKVSSEKVTALLDEFAAEGYRWVSFFDAAFEGTVTQEFVYFSTDPIMATGDSGVSRVAAAGASADSTRTSEVL